MRPASSGLNLIGPDLVGMADLQRYIVQGAAMELDLASLQGDLLRQQFAPGFGLTGS